MEGSKRFKLNGRDLRKVGLGAVIAILGALATYLEITVLDWDFGAYTELAVAVNSVIVNIIRKFITDYSA